MPTHQELTSLALVAVVALLCGIVLTRLRQPAIVGYIVAGVVLGPSGVAIVEDRTQVNMLADIGVLLLVFLIGMELSLRAFKTVLRIALLGSALQIGLALAVMLLLSQVFGWSIELAVLLGFVVALSSTAVAIRMLDDIGELRSEVGRRAVGILLAQDFAVVPMMLFLNAMAGEGGFDPVALLPMILAVGFLAAFVWYLSRRVRVSLPFRRWARRDSDLVPLAALAWCFGAATVSGLIGLSAAYGAFLAGLYLGNSTDRRAMMRATRPIQSVFLMAFFLSIGLLIDLGYIWQNLTSVIVLLLFVTIGKTATNVGILRLLGEPWPRAFLIGVVLGQIGEFSFVIAALGLGSGVIGAEGHRLIVAVIALSLLISPLWLDAARRINKLAATSADTLDGMLHAIYPQEAAAVQQTAGSAGRRLSNTAARAADAVRALVAKHRRVGVAPAEEQRADGVTPDTGGPDGTAPSAAPAEPEPETGAAGGDAGEHERKRESESERESEGKKDGGA